MKNRELFKNSLMINRDPNWYGCIDSTSAETCRASLEAYFDKFNGAMTDVLICVLEQTAMIPSDSITWRGEKYLWKTENGIEVDYPQLDDLYKCFAKHKVDAVQIFIDTMKKKGIRPWITLRMNDGHHAGLPTSFLRSSLFYEEFEKGHVIGADYGWYANCYDFRYPAYPDAILGYIDEILHRYDFFGLELDFMREIRCFDIANFKDGAPIITEYMRKVKKLVSDAEKRVGHDIKISLRTCRSCVDALEFGFDIKAICDEGLVDIIVPSPHYNPSDSALPISEWRDLLHDNDVAIIAGIETNSLLESVQQPYHTKAYTAAFYADGADGIYYNNHEYDTERNRESWKITRDNCLEGYREFVVTFNDCYSDKTRRYKPLPLEFDGVGELSLKIALVKSSDKVRVVVDYIGGNELPTLSAFDKKNVKGTVIEPVYNKKGEGRLLLTENTPVAYDISGISTDGDITLSFRGRGTIRYVSLQIDAG